MSDKPVIFISHSSKDSEIVSALKQQIEVVIQKVEVFATSADDAIPISDEWFPKIREELDKAQALVVIVSQAAKVSPWVNFEIGYFWKMLNGESIYPLVMPGAEIFGPLGSKQAKRLDSESGILAFFNTLCEQYDGEPKRVEVNEILDKLQDKNANLSETDIKAILSDYLRHQYKLETWIRFTKLDVALELPEGSTAKFIKEVAEEWNYEAREETDNGIKFVGVITFGPNPFADYRG